jgi:hypothetical protein
MGKVVGRVDMVLERARHCGRQRADHNGARDKENISWTAMPSLKAIPNNKATRAESSFWQRRSIFFMKPPEKVDSLFVPTLTLTLALVLAPRRFERA